MPVEGEVVGGEGVVSVVGRGEETLHRGERGGPVQLGRRPGEPIVKRGPGRGSAARTTAAARHSVGKRRQGCTLGDQWSERLLLRSADLEPLDLARQRVPVDAEELGRVAELALAALEGLADDRAVHLVQENLVELGNPAAMELVEECPQAQIEQLLQREASADPSGTLHRAASHVNAFCAFAKAHDRGESGRILLIDDSEITLAMEKAVLEARGYEVVATSTLMEFEKTLQTWRPDLILTDIHMPEAKGTDICRTLKNEYGTQDIPIVLFSSLPDDELTQAGRAGGRGRRALQGERPGGDGRENRRAGAEHPLVTGQT